MSEPAVRVHLVQCLCPARHCLMASAAQEPPGSKDEALEIVKATIEAAIASKRINPWCGICKAPREQWTFEVATLPGRTLDELLPEIQRQESQQIATAAAIAATQRAMNN